MKKTLLASLLMLVSAAAWAQPKVVAHRGYWKPDNGAQNSVAAMVRAAENNFYASEFDVWLTSDGVLVCNHDADIKGVTIQNATYDAIKDLTLGNGEKLPKLEDFLKEAALHKDLRLVLEIKTHNTAARNEAAAKAVAQMVDKLEMQDKVDYIAFNLDVCKTLHAAAPSAKVAYLNGDLTPAEVAAIGLTGIDYEVKVYNGNGTWAAEAKALGLETNVWTVDGYNALSTFAADPNIDLITTNDPLLLKEMIDVVGIEAAPEATKRWTFNDEANLLGDLTPIKLGNKSLTVCASAEEAGISVVDGPTAANKAIHLAKTSSLKALLGNAEPSTSYTIMLDIMPTTLSGWNALLQFDPENKSDGDFCIHKSDANLGIGTMGYSGKVELNKWHRIFFVNDNGLVRVYLNGQIINMASDNRWTLSPQGLLFFGDEDGDRQEITTCELAMWNAPLTAAQIKGIAEVDLGKYFDVKASSVLLVDKTDFAITIEGNVDLHFDLPEWIKGVDVASAMGTKDYTFTAEAMAEPGVREGEIVVNSYGKEPVQVTVRQVNSANGVLAPTTRWTFDDAENLLATEGTASFDIVRRGAVNTVVSAAEAGVTAIEGPNHDKGAIRVPADAYLRIQHGQKENAQTSYSFLIDIRLRNFNSQSVFQSNPTNSSDASIFFTSKGVGRNTAGLGYHGTFEVETWYRILMVVDNGAITLYSNGEEVGHSTAADECWTLYNGSLFFADNSKEEQEMDIAEIGYWNYPLSPNMAALLGNPGAKPTAIEAVKVLPADDGIYDILGRKHSSRQSLKPGVYIQHNRKIVVR